MRVRYFAQLRELAGRTEESVETQAACPGELYAELAKKYGFDLNACFVKAAINGEFADHRTELKTGDEVAFIPPVAGG